MRKYVMYGVIFFQVLLITSLVRGIQLSKRASGRIEGLEATKAKLVSEQEKLKKEEEYVGSPYYLEKVAREELHLAKEGETVVIVPEGRKEELGVRKQELGESREKPNWQKWWEVLSGRQ